MAVSSIVDITAPIFRYGILDSSSMYTTLSALSSSKADAMQNENREDRS